VSRVTVIVDGCGVGGSIARPELAPGTSPARSRRRDTSGGDACGVAPSATAEVDDITLAAAQRHDRAAFSRIVACYQDRLRLLAYHHLHDRHLAQDAVQDTFVKAWLALPRFRRGASLGTWLYRIAYTTCIDYERRRARRPEVAAEAALESPELAASNGEAHEHSDLARVLGDLPATQRLVVLLVDREGLDYRTVARIMAISPGTVCSRLSRARKALRHALDEATAGDAEDSRNQAGRRDSTLRDREVAER